MSDLIENLEKQLTEPRPKTKKVDLIPEQETKILEYWNSFPKDKPPSIAQCVEHIFPGEDPRSSKGVAVRKFLSGRELSYVKVGQHVKKEFYLTVDQQEYISNNCGTMTYVEIANNLYPNYSKEHGGKRLTAFCPECKGIRNYIENLKVILKNKDGGLGSENLDESQKFQLNSKIFDNNDFAHEEYLPPKSVKQASARVNKYTNDILDFDKLSQKQKKELEALINYLHSYRFKSQISTYMTVGDRELFESTFIKCTYDKPDLSNEELDQYTDYAAEVVLDKNLNAQLEDFQQKLNQNLDEDKTLSMAMVEAMKCLRDDHDKCIKRKNKLLSDLTGTRKDRISNEIKEKASLVQLIEYFKAYETRKNMINLAELRKKTIKGEIERLENMDSLRLEIFGVTVDEILNS